MNELNLMKPWQWKITNGSRVKVFDYRKYIDDIKTPLSKTMRSATVVCRYGFISKHSGHKYPDNCDVIFDGEEKISEGHFTYGLEPIDRVFN